MRLVLLLLAALGMALGAPSGRAQVSKEATPDQMRGFAAIRAGQIGLLNDLNKALESADTLKLLGERETASSISTRGSDRTTVETKFVGGQHLLRNVFNNELAKITFINLAGAESTCTGIFLDGPPPTGSTSFRVLTAGHCSCGQPDTYKIWLGDDDEIHLVSKRLIAPPARYSDFSCFIPPEDQPGRDLALLMAADRGKAPYKPRWELPAPEQVWVNVASMGRIFSDTATIRLMGAGFGYDETGKTVKRARAAKIPIGSYFCGGGRVANSLCAAFHEFVLADPRTDPGINRPDSCGGDSGAPVYWVPPARLDDAGKPLPIVDRYLVGITSRALAGVRHNAGTTCGGGGIYTALGHPDVAEWLSQFGVHLRTELTPIKEDVERDMKKEAR